MLHGNTARWLASTGADPALVAQHWLEAGDEASAIPFLLEAARSAKAAHRLLDAAGFYERAAELLEAQGRGAEAAEVLLEVGEFILGFDTHTRAERLAEQLLRLAQTPRALTKAWLYRATLYLHRGEIREGGEAAQKALESARRSGDGALEVEPLNLLGVVWRRQGRFQQAQEALERARELALESLDPVLLPAILSNLGLVLQQLNRHGEAARRFEEAFGLQKDRATQVRVLNNLAICLGQLGRSREAIATLERALAMLGEMEGATGSYLVVLTSLANYSRSLMDYRRSLEALEQARGMVEGYQHWKLRDLYRNFARTFVDLGEYERAQHYLDLALEGLVEPGGEATLTWMIQARLWRYSGQNPRQALERAAALTQESNLSGHQMRLEQARLLPAAEGLQTCRHSLEFAHQHGFMGLSIVAHTLCAQAALRLEQVAEALAHTRSAVELAERYDPDTYQGEVWLTHYRALCAGGDPAAPAYLEAAVARLLAVAEQNVPPEQRSSFLRRNPFNRALLEAAGQLA